MQIIAGQFKTGLIAALPECVNAGESAPIPPAPIAEDSKARMFLVDRCKACIYVYRRDAFAPDTIVPITVDGVLSGQTAAMTYLRVEVEPGAHLIGAIAENIAMIQVIAEAGRAYFVSQTMKMGIWKPRTALEQVGAEAGRADVAASSLAMPRV